MTTEDILSYINSANEEEIQVISDAIKGRGKPKRLMMSHVIKEDRARIATVTPKTSTEYNGMRYEETSVFYAKCIEYLTNVITHNFTIRTSTRGYRTWQGHDSILESKADTYRDVYHELTNKFLELMKDYGASY